MEKHILHDRRKEKTGIIFKTQININKKGVDLMSRKNITLMKQTLTAWARILYDEGMITLEKCNRMITSFQKLKE